MADMNRNRMWNYAGILVVVLLSSVSAQTQWPNCTDKSGHIQPIPAEHILRQKVPPLIIGHRGNPRIFQENTYDGFVSLLDTNADGFELDVFLTKDDKLVLFHEPNTEHLTGTDKTIYNMTYDEISSQLRLKKKLKYGNNVYEFNQTRPLPLLDDILKRFENESMLIFIEMKPDTPVKQPDMDYVNRIGAAIGNIVRKYNLENKSVVNSFDFWKVRAAKMSNPELVVGNYFYPEEFDAVNYDSHAIYGSFPGLEACSKAIPDRLQFMRFLFETGAVLKTYNGSFFTTDSLIYNNPLVSNLTKNQMVALFGGQVSGGAYTIYRMAQTIKQIDAQEKEIDNMIKWGVKRLITDDVGRLLRKFNRARQKYPDCISGSTGVIPSNHIFNTKKKPLIIGHRGNPMHFQENTMDGFESLINKTYIDGFELDVFLTADDELVTIFDGNLARLTGRNINVYEATYDEISNLTVTDEITYGNRRYKFSKRRPIPLLEDIYKKFQNESFIIYTEIKSPQQDSIRFEYANRVAKALVDLIAKYNMESKVFIFSFDTYNTMVIKKLNPNLVTGGFLFRGEFTPNFDSKKEYLNFTSLSKCLRVLPNGPKFTEFLLLTGAILKSFQGAFFDIDDYLFPNYLQKTTLAALAKQYGHQPSFGAGALYRMGSSDQQLKAAEPMYKAMVEWGVQRLVTDDPFRTAKLIGRYSNYSTSSTPVWVTTGTISSSLPSTPLISATILLFIFGLVQWLTI
ncbi:uncharacterized protein TRIADDRAFT_56749 [Trichoplax adhaerens]|uniref:GP-PDE domain-containing protein n=1 Tax=Trichoplax adhaerens TaxID=10228 RepID=B3RWH3_TRIAD|nr:hypothetical protein TRIADDRAFT_56749 [Trichoplax adhaerens]EDV25135.1 hypothetical protein TRIADDRAFT_56749 [Trichoplax adhaerens]|eukprot:XP_002113025.1 hypothetical protein TRIADDRAFT_56749 [Trichoplax adhaerens]